MKYLKLFEEHNIIETPEFKKWFNGSKIVDEHGKPLLVYHGIINKRQSIRNNFIWEENTKENFCMWFSPQMIIASGYGDGEIIQAYLNIKNPYIFECYETYKNENEEPLYFDGDEITTTPPLNYDDNNRTGNEVDITYTKVVRDDMVKRGFDGAIQDEPYYSDEIVVFSPEQIWIVK